jgi:hypothetical protein
MTNFGEVARIIEESIMIQVSLTSRFYGKLLVFAAALLAGCTPIYLSDTHTTSTPRSQFFDVAELAREPVATLGFVTPASLQGFNPPLSHALNAALSEASPPIRGIAAHETFNMLNQQGLAGEYGALIAGFGRAGILEREPLQRIGSALSSRYVLLPGLAEFNQVIIDRLSIYGWNFIQSRVTTLRLWLQLWETQTGKILWESAGEVTVATKLLRSEQTVALDDIARKLWLRMIQDNLLEGKPESRFLFSN